MSLISGKGVHQVEQTLEKEINEIIKWLQANQLPSHLEKKYFVWFCLLTKKKH